jgi:hypothetical protein
VVGCGNVGMPGRARECGRVGNSSSSMREGSRGLLLGRHVTVAAAGGRVKGISHECICLHVWPVGTPQPGPVMQTNLLYTHKHHNCHTVA